MEVRNGFIDGVFNYCDRWCETCALTSWCRLFADHARLDAAQDPTLKALVDAPPLPQDVPPPPPRWMQELIDDMNEAAADVASGKAPMPTVQVDFNDHPMVRRARDYGLNVHQWLKTQEGARDWPPDDPRSVIAWFCIQISAKIARALFSRADAEEWDDDPGFHDDDGSAKVALIGIERSHAAWLRLAEAGTNTFDFIRDLVWLGEAVEREFPRARAFVRPGFDEPEAVARLRASQAKG
jgi:hypothetical protein